MKTQHEIIQETSHELEIGDGVIMESRVGMLAVARTADAVRPHMEALRKALSDVRLFAHAMHAGPEMNVSCTFSFMVGEDVIEHQPIVFTKGKIFQFDSSVTIVPGRLAPGKKIVTLVNQAARDQSRFSPPVNNGRAEQLLQSQLEKELRDAQNSIAHQMRDLAGEFYFQQAAETTYRELVTSSMKDALRRLRRDIPMEYLHSAFNALIADDVLDD